MLSSATCHKMLGYTLSEFSNYKLVSQYIIIYCVAYAMTGAKWGEREAENARMKETGGIEVLDDSRMLE